MSLNDKIDELESLIEHAGKSNTAISKGGVAWHIDHSLKVINGIVKTLQTSNPDDYKWSFNATKTLVMTTGVIPRGKAKAPKYVRVAEGTEITEEDLKKQLAEVKTEINAIENLPKNAHFKHPIFGLVNLADSKKFLVIHTNHHLKIIKDIIK